MPPTASTLQRASTNRLTRRLRSSFVDPSDFASLELQSHRGEVQDMIRDAIREGTIRVRPIPGCAQRVSIVSIAPGMEGVNPRF
jgi:hypothetical protein